MLSPAVSCTPAHPVRFLDQICDGQMDILVPMPQFVEEARLRLGEQGTLRFIAERLHYEIAFMYVCLLSRLSFRFNFMLQVEGA